MKICAIFYALNLVDGRPGLPGIAVESTATVAANCVQSTFNSFNYFINYLPVEVLSK